VKKYSEGCPEEGYAKFGRILAEPATFKKSPQLLSSSLIVRYLNSLLIIVGQKV
jgi:hypothetical protein